MPGLVTSTRSIRAQRLAAQLTRCHRDESPRGPWTCKECNPRGGGWQPCFTSARSFGKSRPRHPSVQIKRAYRAKVLQYHPDVCPASERPHAEEAFRQASEAYARLTGRERPSTHPSQPVLQLHVGKPEGNACMQAPLYKTGKPHEPKLHLGHTMHRKPSPSTSHMER